MPDHAAPRHEPSAVSDALRAAIHARGLTAYTIAKRANVGVDPIQRFLNQERGLNLKTLDRVCAALGLILAEPVEIDTDAMRRVSRPATQDEPRPIIGAGIDSPGENVIYQNHLRSRSMNSFFTVATMAQAGLDDTSRLLFNHAAVWVPPMSIPPCGAVPMPGDLFWLLYLDDHRPRVLAGGPLARAPRTMGQAGYSILWNNADRPGLRDDARAVGYGGPHNMTFVRLDPPRLFGLEHAQPVALPDPWSTGLNLATSAHEAALQSVLPL